ncbi:hypothetical protein H6P81_002630 [Aristolochia fimbriata]|uniref:Uncharacterized protein n=1 Tax=Aristolochia fimbriata TaxID=158543 RepID=A0AAV7FAA4_ARIFI|nr:hypothetical protein H6P81_002630 [Aristolochia fimbriata]
MVALGTTTMMMVIMMITKGYMGMRSYLCLVQEIFLRGRIKEAITGYNLMNPQAYRSLFRWDGKNFNRRGSMRKVWQKCGCQVRLLEPKTPAEQELLVAPHGRNVWSYHDRFKEMEARFISTLSMHLHSSNLNVEIHVHNDREDGSCGHTGGIGVANNKKSDEGSETGPINDIENNERKEALAEDEGKEPCLSSIVRGVKEQRRKRKDGPHKKPPFAMYERKKAVKEH